VSVRLQCNEPGSYNVAGSHLFVLAHFDDWAIYDRDVWNAGPIARFPRLADCRAYLNNHPELLSEPKAPQ
jgi:hypothetical protein